MNTFDVYQSLSLEIQYQTTRKGLYNLFWDIPKCKCCILSYINDHLSKYICISLFLCDSGKQNNQSVIERGWRDLRVFVSVI